jgi:hypothetical protein
MSDCAHAPLRRRSLCVYKYPSLMRYAAIPKKRIIGNFLHQHHDPAPQGDIINSHERSDQP